MAEIIKRIGPASYWCRRCAHCNSVELGCMGDVPIYTCDDPYDGVEKKIPGNENITCTMFDLANEVPVYELKKEPCTKISLLEHELEMDKLRREIHQLEKEKSNHMKGIERLKKDNDILRKALDDIAEIVEQPNNTGYNGDICLADKTVRAVEHKVTWLKNEIKNLHALVESSLERECELEEKVESLEHDKKLAKIVSIHNAELKQTIEDQDMTIKALLITIKEMCKDE